MTTRMCSPESKGPQKSTSMCCQGRSGRTVGLGGPRLACRLLPGILGIALLFPRSFCLGQGTRVCFKEVACT